MRKKIISVWNSDTDINHIRHILIAGTGSERNKRRQDAFGQRGLPVYRKPVDPVGWTSKNA